MSCEHVLASDEKGEKKLITFYSLSLVLSLLSLPLSTLAHNHRNKKLHLRFWMCVFEIDMEWSEGRSPSIDDIVSLAESDKLLEITDVSSGWILFTRFAITAKPRSSFDRRVDTYESSGRDSASAKTTNYGGRHRTVGKPARRRRWRLVKDELPPWKVRYLSWFIAVVVGSQMKQKRSRKL